MPDRARTPTMGTLRRYGLDERSYLAICQRQRFRCPICGEPFGQRKLAIDHEHVRGFRARKTRRGRNGAKIKVRVMTPGDRRKHVRGVLHSWCNRFVRRWMTLERAELILSYLQEHERRSKL